MKGLPLFVSTSIAIVYFVMYWQLISPNDETGHSVGWFMVTLLWALINFVNLLRLFVSHPEDRLRLGGLMLLLPAVWFTLGNSFYMIFYTKIVEIHPVWDQGSRWPGGGFVSVVGAAALTILGGVLLRTSRSEKQEE